MWKKITYILIAVIVTVLVTIFTLSMQIKKRNQDVFNTFIEEANTGAYDNFLKYQTKQYKHLEEITLDDYQISLYYTDNLVLFVRPLKRIKHATDRFDDNDQTSLYIHNEGYIYHSKDTANYGDFPISFGLVKMQFYYYQANLKEGSYQFDLRDYEGQIILSEALSIQLEGPYQPGFTSKEIEAMIKADQSYLKAVYVVFGLMVAIGLTVGIVLFRKRHRKI